MRPGKQEWTGGQDLLRARLDQIINMKHELVRLAETLDRAWLDAELAGCFSDERRPGKPYDGHTLPRVIEETETRAGRPVEWAYVGNSFRGLDTPRLWRVFISGQRRGVHGVIKRSSAAAQPSSP
jgi:IS5 family transposase